MDGSNNLVDGQQNIRIPPSKHHHHCRTVVLQLVDSSHQSIDKDIMQNKTREESKLGKKTITFEQQDQWMSEEAYGTRKRKNCLGVGQREE